MAHPRAAELEACFRRIADTRMAGLPFLHPGLAVQAVGFAPEPDAPAVESTGNEWCSEASGLTGRADGGGRVVEEDP